MKYVFKDNIKKEDYDNFVKNFPSTTFMQTSSWSLVKTAWESSFVGMYDNEKLVCAAMILKRKLFLNKKLFYIPRGFVIDYKDKKLLESFTENLRDYAKKNGFDYVLIDTAGRLHIDKELMDELKDIKETVNPNEILLVLDAMMGQDAINVITGFNDSIPLTGVILTKLDGDTRGGVALSVRHLTNVPIKFIGTSEKMDGLDLFYPDRMASRIIGMGDVLSIVDKANEVIDEKDAKDTLKKMQSGKFDLEDFLNQMKQMKKLGPLEGILKLLPGAKNMGLDKINIDPKELAHVEAIILSMTPYERKHPEILKASRKERIAKGSGRSVQEVNSLLKRFEDSKRMMQMMMQNGKFKMPF